jgi:hypothetical protein
MHDLAPVIEVLPRGDKLTSCLKNLSEVKMVVVHGMAESVLGSPENVDPEKLARFSDFNSRSGLVPDLDVFISYKYADPQVEGAIYPLEKLDHHRPDVEYDPRSISLVDGVFVIDPIYRDDKLGVLAVAIHRLYAENAWDADPQANPYEDFYGRTNAKGEEMFILGDGASNLDGGLPHERRQIAIAELLPLELHDGNTTTQELIDMGYSPKAARGVLNTSNGVGLNILVEEFTSPVESSLDNYDLQISRLRLTLKSCLQDLLKSPPEINNNFNLLASRVANLSEAFDINSSFYYHHLLGTEDTNLATQALGLLDIMAPCLLIDPLAATELFDRSGLFKLMFGRHYLEGFDQVDIDYHLNASRNLLDYLGRLTNNTDLTPSRILGRMWAHNNHISESTVVSKIELLESIKLPLAKSQNPQSQ